MAGCRPVRGHMQQRTKIGAVRGDDCRWLRGVGPRARISRIVKDAVIVLSADKCSYTREECRFDLY
eukprot:scaffold37642_cov30-Tisochrysis_lutea.AAC.8